MEKEVLKESTVYFIIFREKWNQHFVISSSDSHDVIKILDTKMT